MTAPPVGWNPAPPQPAPPLASGPPPPGMRWPGATECLLCGCVPATPIRVRTHRGMVIVMRFSRRDFAACRACGTEVIRHENNQNLLLGWWGVLSAVFFNWFALISNLRQYRRLNAMPPAQYRDPAVASPYSAPLPAGRPVWQRPGFAVTVAVVLAIVIAGIYTSRQPTQVSAIDPRLPGTCVQITDLSLDGAVDCTAHHDGMIVTIVANPGACPVGTEAYMSSADPRTVCVDRAR
ncbi:MAG: hypothetical protein E6J20_19690 [Chloroflexi bacterium]|nr:MAG: hypothetical protein E6J20_19690 [Chloroflexota bacterium]